MSALHKTALSSYLALIGLTISWEGWLAPSPYAPRMWFMLKTLPLILLLYGLVRGNRKIYFLACLLILLYFSEGVVLSYAHIGANWHLHGTRFFAGLETLFAVCFFFSAAWYARRPTERVPGETIPESPYNP